MSRNAAILLLSLALGCRVPAYPRARDLTNVEARDLVMRALDPQARRLPKLSIEVQPSKIAEYYEFSVTWDNPKGSVVVGFFAVNRSTGDVWKLVVCRRVDSPDLRALQKRLRLEIRITRSELSKLRDSAPCER